MSRPCKADQTGITYAVAALIIWAVFNIFPVKRLWGRDLHSSTSQLNISRLWSPMPQLTSTPQLDVRRFLSMQLPK
jgi:hypothetical protein